MIQSLRYQLYDMGITINIHLNVPILQKCKIFTDTGKFIYVLNAFLVLMAVPVINNILYPFLREYLPNMRKRIGVGSLLSVLSVLSAFILSVIGSTRDRTHQEYQCMFFTDNVQKDYDFSPVSGYYVIISLVLITIGEIFINVTCESLFKCYIILTRYNMATHYI